MRRTVRRASLYLAGVALGLAAAGSAWGQGTLIPPALYAVQGAPFSATIELTWDGTIESGPGHRVSRLMRDSAGRQRYEIPTIEEALAAGTRPQVTIYDVPGEKIISLDVLRRTATVRAIAHVGRTVSIDPPARRGYPCRAAEGVELLGVRTFAGLEACGQRRERTVHRQDGDETVKSNLWLSTNYLMPLMEESQDATRGKWTQQVSKLEAGEPDAALFRIPESYEVLEQPLPQPAVPNGDASTASATEPGVAKIGGKVSAPVVLFAPEPEFSEEARHDKVGGTVLVYLQVNEKGEPMHVRVIRGVGHGLDLKAVEAVERYRFKPAMRDGQPVTVEMNVQVNFQIFTRRP